MKGEREWGISLIRGTLLVDRCLLCDVAASRRYHPIRLRLTVSETAGCFGDWYRYIGEKRST
jgi:hypothetical protein